MTTPKDIPPETPDKSSESTTAGKRIPDRVEGGHESGKPPDTRQTPETPTLGAQSPVESPDGLSFSQVGGVELVPQEHGGALKRGNPGNTGHRVATERRRARAERSEAVDDAMVGHVEKMSEIIGDLVEQAGGEQYRCTCGVLGPKVPKLKLREATEVAAILMRAVKQPDTAVTVIPIQINVHAGGPMVPGITPPPPPTPEADHG